MGDEQFAAEVEEAGAAARDMATNLVLLDWEAALRAVFGVSFDPLRVHFFRIALLRPRRYRGGAAPPHTSSRT